MNISIILPTHSLTDPIIETLNAINNQTFRPNEIIIIDSCNSVKIQLIIENYTSSIPIIYHWVPKAFPGHARNIGVNQAKNDVIAFLDSKTIPEKYWLSDYLNFFKIHKILFIQGKTYYLAENFFQNIIKSATFGNHSHNTLPGSLIQKSYFKKIGGFNQSLRAGEDQEFINKIYEYEDDTYPAWFHFKGAGWGHGVGMCQIGALGMALTKKTYSEILNHYFPGTHLHTLYE
mgnify:CR=1 FL=1